MKQIVDFNNKLRVVGFCSNSGNTLWKALELQKQLELQAGSCSFEVIGMFCDDPFAKCMTTAKKLGIPAACIDIKAFYEQHGALSSDMSIRKEYDATVLQLLEAFHPDIIILAGYVWAVTEEILNFYPIIGVHPGDLTYQENGKRLLAGANGVKAAFRFNRNELRASSFIVTTELDNGPLLITSPAVSVDYEVHPDDDERFRFYLKLVNEQSRLVGANTLLEVANRNFYYDDNDFLCYKGKHSPFGIKLESWEGYYE